MRIKEDTPNVRLTGKNVIITGATAGIGKETARTLAKMGANIIFATRNKEKTLNTIAEIRADIKNNTVKLEHKYIDLMDLDTVRNFPSLLNDFDTIDVLINNAGVGHEIGITKQGIEKIFGINYLSHFLLTKELMPFLLKTNARIINVSSMGYRGANRKHFDMPYKGESPKISPQRFYELSKAGQILFTKALQRRFVANNISCTSTCLSPGGVRTNIFESYNLTNRIFMRILWPFMVNIPEGAKTSVYLASTERPKETAGKYFSYGFLRKKGIYKEEGNALVNDEELQEFLWKKSEELIGEEFRIG